MQDLTILVKNILWQSRRVLAAIVVFALIAIVAWRAFRGSPPAADVTTKTVRPIGSAESVVTNSQARFFQADGTPIMGYARDEKNKIQLFSTPDGTGPQGQKIQPVTAEILAEARAEAERLEKVAKETELKQVEEQKQIAEQHKVEEARIAAEREAGELRKYRERYTYPGAHCRFGILAVSETGNINRVMAQAVVTSLESLRTTATASCLRPEFVSDGLFEKAVAGTAGAFDKLTLTNFVDCILLIKEQVEFKNDERFKDVISANATAVFTAIDSDTHQSFFEKSISTVGAGVSKAEASSLAEERLLKEFNSQHLQTLVDTANRK